VRGRLGRASYIAITTRFRDPGPPPDPPDRVRTRPVLHLEEPAATLAVLTVVFVLVLLLVITRIVQRWLETELLPHSRIEPSLQEVNAQLAAPNRRWGDRVRASADEGKATTKCASVRERSGSQSGTYLQGADRRFECSV
jgi:hypothetical protein